MESHICNVSYVATSLMNLAKGFLSQRSKELIKLHTDFESMHK